MNLVFFWILCIAALVIAYRLNQWLFNLQRKRRRDYYRETLSISKNVKGFMPSVHSFNPITNEINGLKEPFQIKF